MKKSLIIVALLFVSMFVFHSAASAAWYEATVSEAGIDPISGVTFVRLTYVSGPSPAWTGALWYTASGENGKAMLAVGLTAISIGNNVTVSLANVAEWSLLSGLFMKSE